MLRERRRKGNAIPVKKETLFSVPKVDPATGEASLGARAWRAATPLLQRELRKTKCVF
jgi:hypothetical protein